VRRDREVASWAATRPRPHAGDAGDPCGRLACGAAGWLTRRGARLGAVQRPVGSAELPTDARSTTTEGLRPYAGGMGA
jgi:hypothetical protein